MSASRLLEDANLADVVLRNGTSSVEFLFLNMTDGGEIGTLICIGVALFIYHSDPDDGLPHYVGEVNHSLLSRAEVRTLLDRFDYDFNSDAVVRHDMEQLHHIEMAGSVSVTVLCRSMEFRAAG